MNLFMKKTLSLENLLKKNNCPKNSILMATRYYLNYFITKDKIYLSHAINTLVASFNENKSDLDVYFFIIFLYIENENYEKANYYFKILKDNKKYFKNNEQNHYIVVLFLQVCLEKYSAKHLKKFRKAFQNEDSRVFTAREYFIKN